MIGRGEEPRALRLSLAGAIVLAPLAIGDRRRDRRRVRLRRRQALRLPGPGSESARGDRGARGRERRAPAARRRPAGRARGARCASQPAGRGRRGGGQADRRPRIVRVVTPADDPRARSPTTARRLVLGYARRRRGGHRRRRRGASRTASTDDAGVSRRRRGGDRAPAQRDHRGRPAADRAVRRAAPLPAARSWCSGAWSPPRCRSWSEPSRSSCTLVAAAAPDRGDGRSTSSSINIVTALGLGLAIDYSLFVVSRYREELAEREGPGGAPCGRRCGVDGPDDRVTAGSPWPRALASLCVFPQRFLYSIGVGGSPRRAALGARLPDRPARDAGAARASGSTRSPRGGCERAQLRSDAGTSPGQARDAPSACSSRARRRSLMIAAGLPLPARRAAPGPMPASCRGQQRPPGGRSDQERLRVRPLRPA